MDKNYIFIGDNLSIMQDEAFSDVVSQVDTIYIDPPYNTKSCFSYADNKEHSEWLNFIKLRLIQSQKLLKETGVIFISIDDNEYAYLKIICDEIFNRENFLGTFITRQSQRSNAKYINTTHEYILCYAKNKKRTKEFKIKRILIPEDRKIIEGVQGAVSKIFSSTGREDAQKKLNELIKKFVEENNATWLKNYNCIDDEGRIYFGKDLSVPSEPNALDIPEIGLYLDPLPTRGWASKERFIELYKNDKLVYKNGRPYEKHLLTDAEDHASSVLNFYSRQGTNDLNKLGLHNLFDTPKPVELIKYLIRISTPKDGIVMDFFGGSGTTAQAVYELNDEEKASRNYILIQLDENIDLSSKAYAECLKYKISPIISEVMLLRINTFLKLNHKSCDYLLTIE